MCASLTVCFLNEFDLGRRHQVLERVGGKNFSVVPRCDCGQILLEFGQFLRIYWRRWCGTSCYARTDLQELPLEPCRRDDAEKPRRRLTEVQKTMRCPAGNMHGRSGRHERACILAKDGYFALDYIEGFLALVGVRHRAAAWRDVHVDE